MTDVRSLTRHISRCHATGERLQTDAADGKLWFLALGHLLQRGELDKAAFAAPRLAVAFPDSQFIRQNAMLLERAPPAAGDKSFAQFIDDPGADVQVVRHGRATRVLIVFCGRHRSLGMPMSIAHRWFGGLNAHVVYLRDPRSAVYEAGLPSLAADRAGTVRALTSIAADLGADRIACYGNSTGGYGALLYGLELGATAVLAINATVAMPDWAMSRGGVAGSPVPRLDLPALYAAAPVRPRVRFVYGAGSAHDTQSAEAMTSLPGVTIDALPDHEGHDAHIGLILQGRFDAVLRELVADDRVEDGRAR